MSLAIRYGSVCSGIEAATCAWHPLGWIPSFFSEIEAFPRAVLKHHYPHIPLHGDFTTILADDYEPIDLLVGGTPCQSFSIAGLRGGLGDDRGNLALEFLRLAQRLRPRWVVWENVPGVLSSNGGRDFGAILGGMVELGYGFAYRILDAQFFGVAQRRRRVFVVGCLGDWRSAAAVLFERHCLQGHPPPRREARQGTAVGALTGALPSGKWRIGADETTARQIIPELICVATGQAAADMAADMAPTLNCNHEAPYIAHSIPAEGFDASEDVIVRGTPPVTVAFSIMPMNSGKDYKARAVDVAQPIMAGGPVGGNQGGDVVVQSNEAVAFAQNSRDELREMPYVGALSAEAGMKQTSYLRLASAVRRLTPCECERLQGFPDNFTLVSFRGKPAADGPRYKALGNSMAVPCMAWIGRRIQMVETMTSRIERAA